MGFSRFRLGPTLPCGIEDGILRVILTSGVEIKYQTNLKVNIPMQTIPFDSYTVLFCLDHEGKTYIGRADGSISIYAPCGGSRLVGLNNWQAPKSIVCHTVGYHAVGNRVEDIYLDPNDGHILYHGDKGEYFIMEEPLLQYSMQSETSRALAMVQSTANQINSIVMQNGKEVMQNVQWRLPSLPGSGNKRKFI